MSMRAPCYKCVKRELGCHQWCEDYARFVTEREKIRGFINLQHIAEERRYDSCNYVIKKKNERRKK